VSIEADAVAKTPCPECGALALRIETRLETREVGTFSLAGQVMKFSASWVPWLVCDGCGIEARGERA